MSTNSGKLAAGLLLLISVWTGVYWVYEPSSPPITLDTKASEEEAGAEREPVASPVMPPLMSPFTKSDASVTPPLAEKSRAIAVIPPEFMEYTVQAGDTFKSISTRFYGSGAHADAITRVNGLGDAGRLLTPGRTIRLARDPKNLQGRPAQTPTSLEAAKPPVVVPEIPGSTPPVAAKATRTYVVQGGDSLSKIAKRFYDDASQWERIYEANKASMKGPHDLKLGAVLVIPE